MEETYIIYKKSASSTTTYWPKEEVVVPAENWTYGWDKVVEYLSGKGVFAKNGTYAIQNKTGQGMCIVDIKVPETPTPTCTFL